MNKTVVIHQPDFLPHLGFFHKFLQADLWVILDNVQFLSGSKSWHNRDKIKTAQGAKWLTVAVKKSPRRTLINEVELAQNTNWREKNINLLKVSYRNAKYFNEIWPHIEELYNGSTLMLAEFNIQSIKMLSNLLGISIQSIHAKELAVDGKKNELLANIVKKVEGTHYLSGVGARDYFSPIPFDRAGIEVLWDQSQNPIYPQLFGTFIPGLSAIDLLFNCGISDSRKIVRGVV